MEHYTCVLLLRFLALLQNKQERFENMHLMKIIWLRFELGCTHITLSICGELFSNSFFTPFQGVEHCWPLLVAQMFHMGLYNTYLRKKMHSSGNRAPTLATKKTILSLPRTVWIFTGVATLLGTSLCLLFADPVRLLLILSDCVHTMAVKFFVNFFKSSLFSSKFFSSDFLLTFISFISLPSG